MAAYRFCPLNGPVLPAPLTNTFGSS
eukprot:COSAG01_NODE_27101_length_694_cov_1.115966_2_plen_25_part_01